jgi:mono/diheme cytochrome c family protein
MKYLNVIILTGCVAVGFSAAAAPVDWSKLPPAATTEGVTFEKDIQPLFKASCVQCHGANRPKANLRLDTLEGVLKGTKDGAVLKSGDSANSLLVKAVSQLDSKTAMPPKPRARRGPGGPQGTNAPAMQSRDGGPMAGGPEGGQPPRFRENEGGDDHGPGERPPGGPQGTNAPGMRPRNSGPPAKPLTAEQVGLVRAWIDQDAK